MAKPLLTLAAAAIGPVTVNLLGYDVPVLSAILSLSGSVLASLIAPAPASLAGWQRGVLIVLLAILALGLVLSDPGRSPLIATCWAIGIGYSGLPLIREIQRIFFDRFGALFGASSKGGPDVGE